MNVKWTFCKGKGKGRDDSDVSFCEVRAKARSEPL